MPLASRRIFVAGAFLFAAIIDNEETDQWCSARSANCIAIAVAAAESRVPASEFLRHGLDKHESASSSACVERLSEAQEAIGSNPISPATRAIATYLGDEAHGEHDNTHYHTLPQRGRRPRVIAC
jgi:hypothetical protein